MAISVENLFQIVKLAQYIASQPAATLPLSGTELIPIVQDGTTKNIFVDEISGSLGPIVTAPVYQGSPGTPYEIAFDASGNLYICYAANTWAKYANIAPFGPQPTSQQDAQPLGMP